MKTHIKNLVLLPVLMAGLGLIVSGRLTAQTFTALHTFTGLAGYPSQGGNPHAGLILSGNTLYGTASYGGTNASGTVFAVNTDGTGFTILHTFTPATYDLDLQEPAFTNRDGYTPNAGLVLSGNTLYGTAGLGGTNGNGTVFAVNTDGTGFKTIYTFTADSGFNNAANPVNNDGGNPAGVLILSSNTLYGTASYRGTNGLGTVFKLKTDGTGFTTLYSFPLVSFGFGSPSAGGSPYAGLLLSGNTLYGTAYSGGTNGTGSVFAVKTEGTGFTNLYNFTALDQATGTNGDGANPSAGLILSSNTLYGTTDEGGTNGHGTVFAVNTDGTGFTNLHNFRYFGSGGDGSLPWAGLVLCGNTLYGTAEYGGSWNNGTVFAVKTDGTGFTDLYTFTPLSLNTALLIYTNSDGANPAGSLVLSGNTLYGTAEYGGSWDNGTVFSLTLPVNPPQLTIIHSGANVILMWPTNYAGFILQSTTNLVFPVWTTNFPAPAVVSGQNTVSNPISGTRKFYRLSE